MVTRKLGDIAFYAHESSVTRTIVSRIGLDGKFDLLEHSHSPVCWDFPTALAITIAKLKTTEKELEEKLVNVRNQIDRVRAPEYMLEVAVSPFIRRPQTSYLAGTKEEIMDMPVPSKYFEPGQRVYCAITPKTLNLVNSLYRPHAYFVLESTIKEVQLLARGVVDYRLDSDYKPCRNHIYPCLEDAKRGLLETFAAETGGTLQFEMVKLVL